VWKGYRTCPGKYLGLREKMNSLNFYTWTFSTDWTLVLVKSHSQSAATNTVLLHLSIILFICPHLQPRGQL
jgi:hypothetical protein